MLPVNPVIADLAASHRLVVTVEDSNRIGGVGSAVTELLTDHGVGTPIRIFGLEGAFLGAGRRADLLADQGLTADHMAEQVRFTIVGHGPSPLMKVAG